MRTSGYLNLTTGKWDQLPSWTRPVLIVAGVYNIIWGAWVVFFPGSFFTWSSMKPPEYPMIWQSVGMIVGLYGLGYLAAAFDPVRFWFLVFIGLLGKILGPLGAGWYAISGELPWIFGLINIFNDLIWLIPFSLIVSKTYQLEKLQHSSTE